jgi:hypothetical protein
MKDINIQFIKQRLLEEVDMPGDQEKLDVAPPKGKITGADFAALRSKKEAKEPHSQKADSAIDASEKKFLQKIYKDTPIEKIPEKHRWAFEDKSIKRENFVSKVDMKELEHELARLKRENPGKRISYDFITSLKYPKGYVIKIDGKIPDEKSIDISKVMKEENQDHEVSMALASLKEIISNANQLMSKLGEEERDIPGWIQDHITNSENYIAQANKGYHEFGDKEISNDDVINEIIKHLNRK